MVSTCPCVPSGGAGNDILIIDSEDKQANIHGGVGNDIVQVVGDSGVTLNMAEAEVEIAQGGRCADTFIGGGTSTVYIDGEDGNDILIGGAANDAIVGDDGEDFIDGGYGNDVLRGNRGNDSVYGGGGDDYEAHNVRTSGRIATQCCEPILEEPGAGNPHAGVCGGSGHQLGGLSTRPWGWDSSGLLNPMSHDTWNLSDYADFWITDN